MKQYREIKFPNPTLADDEGLVALGGDLEPDMLLEAYTHGIFPWTSEPYVSWWSPNPRAIFYPKEFKLSKRAERGFRNTKMKFTLDKDFKGVIKGCASAIRNNDDSTWIDQNFIDAYIKFHELGFAHSCEAWLDDKLVGGVYGVALGHFFAGESMFHIESNASTYALNYLMKILSNNDFVIFDSQVINDHTKSLGAVEIPRDEYLKILKVALK